MRGAHAVRQARESHNIKTYPPVDFVLLHFALRLDHKERVVEQEDHQIAAVSLPTSTLLEGALVDELATLLLEAEVLQRGARR